MSFTPRLLPLPLPPVRHETIGSYLHRLAEANHLTIGDITRLLECARRPRRVDHTVTGWDAATLARLATLTGRPAPALCHALQTPQPSPHPRTGGTSTPHDLGIQPACRLCAARLGITGIVIQRVPGHHRICLRHRRWLPGPQQHHLDQLPEILRAARGHRRFAHRHPAAQDVHHQARHLTRRWFTTGTQPALQDRWQQRLHALGDDPYGDPHRPSEHRIELATYPDAVVLTGLLASAHWRTHPHLLDEAARRLGATIQPSPELDALTNANFGETTAPTVSTDLSTRRPATPAQT